MTEGMAKAGVAVAVAAAGVVVAAGAAAEALRANKNASSNRHALGSLRSSATTVSSSSILRNSDLSEIRAAVAT